MRLPLYNFMNIPRETCEATQARYAVLPVPYEAPGSLVRGTADAPAAIIDASAKLGVFDQELSQDIRKAGIVTLPSILPSERPDEQMNRIASTARAMMRSGKFLLTIGGEHSITAPLVKAAAEQHDGISVLQIDARPDLRGTPEDGPHSHACVMRRVLEVTDRLAQVGIRSFSSEEQLECPHQVERFITPSVVESDPRWIDRVLSLLAEKVYITIDVCGFDPIYFPATTAPEPEGLTWRQVAGLLRRVCTERQVVSADIVEVVPLTGLKASESMAARLACKIIGYMELSHSEN